MLLPAHDHAHVSQATTLDGRAHVLLQAVLLEQHLKSHGSQTAGARWPLGLGAWSSLGHGGGRLVNNSHASIEAVYPDYGFTHRIYAIDVQGVLERSV